MKWPIFLAAMVTAFWIVAPTTMACVVQPPGEDMLAETANFLPFQEQTGESNMNVQVVDPVTLEAAVQCDKVCTSAHLFRNLLTANIATIAKNEVPVELTCLVEEHALMGLQAATKTTPELAADTGVGWQVASVENAVKENKKMKAQKRTPPPARSLAHTTLLVSPTFC